LKKNLKLSKKRFLEKFSKNMTEKVQDFFLTCKECILENPRSFYGNFRIGPFSNSQSLTVANALRRTLLAEFQNIAITHLEINDFVHEYTTIDGVRESMIDLLLNFKQIILQTSESIHSPFYGYLHVRGPGIIRASDLKLPSFCQVIDPDQYIATLSENGKLKIRFRISTYEYDKDFSLVSFQPKERTNPTFYSPLFHLDKAIQKLKPRGIWLDPVFNPILKVNYLIERIEPFQKTQNFNIFTSPSFVETESTNLSPFGKSEEIHTNMPKEMIFLEIWTNGSLHPRQALYKAFTYLKKMFENLEQMQKLQYQFLQGAIESEEVNTKLLKTFEYNYEKYHFKEKNQKSSVSKKLSLEENKVREVFLEDLNLPERILLSFQKNKIFTVKDFKSYSIEKLKKLPGIGNYGIYSLEKALQLYNGNLRTQERMKK
jgi:DNA-directed RNA polymerase subunit alpha